MKDKKLNKVPLSKSHPELSKEWHPTKNKDLTPDDVYQNSIARVWWKCSKGPDHEWEVRVFDRVRGHRCPFCIFYRLSLTNCLLTLHPELVKNWHPTKNGKLSPKNIIGTGNKKYWWRCLSNKNHEWEASINSRVRKDGTYRGCPICRKRSLSETNPEIAIQWHPTKNKPLTPENVVAGSATYAWWKCPNGPDHEWKTKIVERLKTGCPFCDGKKVSITNSLLSRYPELAKEFHPTKNGDIKPSEILGGGHKKYWWKCSKGPDHEWEASIGKRSTGRGCPICRGLKVVKSNCLSITHPEIAKEWHPTKNGDLTPEKILGGTGKKVWWLCSKCGNSWDAKCSDRIRKHSGCSYCSGHRVASFNSLAKKYPEIAKELHPTKNGKLTANDVTAKSGKKVWWQCSKNNTHEWEATVYNRTNGYGCPRCNSGWTVENIRHFIKSILPYINTMLPPELYALYKQNGLISSVGKSKNFINALKTGKFPKEELEKFINGKKSLVDSFINDDSHEEILNSDNEELKCITEDDVYNNDELPIIETKDVLAKFDDVIAANVDKEVVDFFINSAIAKIWRHVFIDENLAISQLEKYHDKNGAYAREVKLKFLEQYEGARGLTIPSGYNFRINGKLILPNIMQCFTAFMVKKLKRYGNWSGTGAGKTLSAILSSRVIDAKISVICCPNSVVDGWAENIKNIYPESIVVIKSLKSNLSPESYQYIILNYEFFQQSNAGNKLKKFIQKNRIDFVIIDEIHFSKQRVAENISKRKKVISEFLSEVKRKNDDLHVLGMSATPVINNLYEGKSLIEMITGYYHEELQTNATTDNCIALYQKFISHGLRWMPKYKQKISVKTIEVNCSSFINKIKQLKLKYSMVDLEGILTQAKIPEIIKHLKPNTIVYTHYLKNIIHILQEEIEKQGWKTAVYSGDDKSGLDDFLCGNIEVLIATSCLGTGIDGLQYVCNRIIINSLPWTHAEFEQLKGRIYRQGQKSDQVDIIVPLTYAIIKGERWSWCESRWKRIQFKKSIADAAVEGIIPEGHLRTPAQAYQDALKWLERLEKEGMQEIERKKIDLTLSDKEYQEGLRKFGDFSKMNHLINASSSSVTHDRFLKNPEEWKHYHTLYREARKEWAVIPCQEAIKWCKARPHLIVGDFGCGEAFLAKELDNKIYSLDHIAINENVIECDLAKVPLDEESLDAVIFSLSLMGSNFTDYIYEAYRCLKLDGTLWIAEASSRFKNLEGFLYGLEAIGFDVVKSKRKGDFTFVRAIKSDRISREIDLFF